MKCERSREAISARLDGEDPGLATEALEGHLRECATCRAFQARAIDLHRETRAAAVTPATDLTAAILLAVGASQSSRSARKWTLGWGGVADLRLALASVAIVQLALALPALVLGIPGLGGDEVPAHMARHLGALGVAVAVGFLAVSWRPARADGMLPVVATLVVGLVVASGFDLTAGRAVGIGEAIHALELAGLVFTWLLRRATDAPLRLARV